jgi:hypothetical protein
MRAMSDPQPTPPPVMPAWSAYAGEEFNLTERRPLAILGETEKTFVVEGFYHLGRFWKTVIPKTGVSKIIGQRINFSKPKRQTDGTTRASLFFLNHVQARLIMEPDRAVRLYPASAEPIGEPAHQITDFCYSVEAVGPYGRRWNVSDALLGNLAIVHRFLSTQDVAFERIVRQRMTILQSPPLPLDAHVRDRMMCEAIRASEMAGISLPYFMVRPPGSATNCTSEPLKLLDRVLRTPGWQRFFHRLPIHPRGYLQLRGLWQDGQAVPTLNDEMADWLASNDAKLRRQIHVANKRQVPKRPAPKVSLWRNLSSFFKALRSNGR